MPQLIVRGVEEKVVRELKKEAGAQGISAEEAHRRILRKALLKKKTEPSLFEHLLAIPKGGPDDLFERQKDYGRDIEL